jgi:microcystin-dependent protein
MPTPFLGEIKIISWNFPPKGWAFCNGQLLPINQNQALFSILGTTYGGDGRVNFGLPNLQGRMPVHVGEGITLGQLGGQTAHTLIISELSAHVHQLSAINATADTTTPGNVPSSTTMPAQGKAAQTSGTVDVSIYGTGTTNGAMGQMTNTGGSQPHENMSPYLALYFVIALQGVFPSQN